jgi:hypothetical protein
MAQNIVNGLFGITPADIYDAYNAQDRRVAVDLMNNPTLAQMGIYYGTDIGQGLGRGVASLLGAEDPRLQQARVMQEAQQAGYDVTTPEGLQQLAQFFVQRGQPGLASQVATQAQTMSRSAAEEQYKLAQAQAALREKQPKPGEIVDIQNWNRALQDAGGNEQLAAQIYQQREDQRGIAKAQAMRPVTNVSMPPGEKQYDIDRAKMDVETVKDYQKTAQAAVQELPNIERIDQLAQGGKLYTGPLSDVKSYASNFLVSAGLATKDQAAKVSNNAEFTAAASAGVLARIKKLGVNPTDADRKFAEQMGPLLATNPQAIIQVNNYIRQRANEAIAEAKRVRTFADKNKGLSGFEFNPNVAIGAQGGSVPASTNVDLKQFYRK